MSRTADRARGTKAKQSATVTRERRRLQARPGRRAERGMGGGIHVEGGEKRGVGEAARGRSLGEKDIEQVVLIGSADTLREREREAQSLESAQVSNSREDMERRTLSSSSF